jgi:alpha-glucosidase
VWYDFYSGKRHEGKQRVTLAAPLSVIPVLARAGAVIPMRPVVQYVDQAPLDPLTLVVFPTEQQDPVSSSLYEDDGKTFSYRSGVYARRSLTQARTNARLTLTISAQEGSYTPPPRSLVISVVGMTRPPSAVTLNDIPVSRAEAARKTDRPSWQYQERDGTLELTCRDTRTAQRISLTYGN